MVIAYHLIFGAYGFWLPGDPRGSWSDFVRSIELYRYGPAHPAGTTRSVAHAAHDSQLRESAKQALRYPPVQLDGLQARACARGFARVSEISDYRLHACSILPDHAHFVVARHPTHRIETIAGRLKAEAAKTMTREGIHPMTRFARNVRTPSAWARGSWQVYLSRPEAIRRAIQYVEQNPIKQGKKKQQWNFITPYPPAPPDPPTQ